MSAVSMCVQVAFILAGSTHATWRGSFTIDADLGDYLREPNCAIFSENLIVTLSNYTYKKN